MMSVRLSRALANAPYVVVTLAANGVTHAWGPFDSRKAARREQRRFARGDPDGRVLVMKVLPVDPPGGWSESLSDGWFHG